MGKRDPRVDAYIAKSADFARPILERIREIVHEACPEVEEEMKWSRPHFGYKGMLCGMSGFKEHCSFGFWKGQLIEGLDAPEDKAMGHFGKLTKPSDLPSKKVLIGFIKQAMKLNEEGVKAPHMVNRKKRPPLPVPPELEKALTKNPKAKAAFEAFSQSHRNEYAEWIADAKTDATREKRIATAIEWISEGKGRNWKYAKC